MVRFIKFPVQVECFWALQLQTKSSSNTEQIQSNDVRIYMKGFSSYVSLRATAFK